MSINPCMVYRALCCVSSITYSFHRFLILKNTLSGIDVMEFEDRSL